MGLTRFLARCLSGLAVLAAVSCAGRSIDRAGGTTGGAGAGGTTGGVADAGGVGGRTTGGVGGATGALGGGGGVAGSGNMPGGGTGGTGGYVPGDDCDAVACPETEECSEDREFRRPAGACCWACVPVGPPACIEIACPAELHCARGFAPGNGANGCCHECVPDSLYCESDDACLLAQNLGSCCECPQAISRRLYEESACYSSVADPRLVPEECYGEKPCLDDCGCPTPPVFIAAVCENERCTSVPGPER